jgi:hypothetical protein
MDTQDDKVDFWFYAQTREVFEDVRDTLDALIAWDRHRRIHLLGFRSDVGEEAFRELVAHEYMQLESLAAMIRESRGLIKMRWITLLQEVERAQAKYKTDVELALSAF